MSLDPAELALGAQQARHTPPPPHLPITPARHARRHAARHREDRLDGMGRGQSPTQRPRQAQPDHRQRLLQSFPQTRSRIRVDPLQPTWRRLQRRPGGRVARLVREKMGRSAYRPTIPIAPPGCDAGRAGGDGIEPGRFPSRRTVQSLGPEPATLRASVGSTEASESLLARVGVVGPTRAWHGVTVALVPPARRQDRGAPGAPAVVPSR
jgi:hypothetical protein